MIAPWPLISSKPLGNFRIFTMRSDRKISPRTNAEHDFVVLECSDWVHVIAETDDGQLIFVRQWRHGSNTAELEVPGGIMDVDDKSPLETAQRELLEETGYRAGETIKIGEVFANPAIMNNKCHFVVCRNCRLERATDLDGGEDIETVLLNHSALEQIVAAGGIGHSLVVAALFFYQRWKSVGLRIKD